MKKSQWILCTICNSKTRTCIREDNADSVILKNGEKIYLPRNKYSDFVRQYCYTCETEVFRRYSTLEPFIEIAARLIEGYCMLLIFSEFGEHRIKNRLLNGIVTITAWVTISKTINIFVFHDGTFSLENRIFSLILRMIAAYLIGVLLYRNRPLIHCFSVLLFIAFTYISIQITQGTGFLLYHITDQLVICIDSMNDPDFIRFLTDFIKILTDAVSVTL